jgi:hypothetical protein
MEENLNKENFWNELQIKYPDAMKIFCDWIDQYKNKVDWQKLFARRTFKISEEETSAEYENRISKFHEIPLAMQIGIWIEYVVERGGCNWTIENMFEINWREEIANFIMAEQINIIDYEL